MSNPPPIPPDQPNIPPVPHAAPPFPGQPRPYDPSAVSPKSTMGGGTKALLFGCLGLVVLVLIAAGLGGKWAVGKFKGIMENPEQFVAEQLVKAHPDLELVSVDKAAHSLTLRHKSSGETLTARLEDFKDGRIILTKSDGSKVELTPAGLKATDKDGNQTQIGGGAMAPPPDWVPAYPGAASPVMSSQVNTDGAVRGVYAFITPDDPAAAKASMGKALTAGGFKLEENPDTPGVSMIKGTGAAEDGAKRAVTAMITSTDGGTQVTLNFDQSLPEK